MLRRLLTACFSTLRRPPSRKRQPGCILATAALVCAQLLVALLMASFLFVQPLSAQNPPPDLLAPQIATKKHAPAKSKPQESSSQHPSLEIPLEQLGFAAPSIFHLGDRWVQSSLDFLDENHLLFTFRVPGLIVRDHLSNETSNGSIATAGRNIRALVLALPSGEVQADALWHLHDYATYLWPLTGGRFLLRDRNLIQVGDASLHLQPFLRFPGAVKYLELNPDQTMLVTQNLEPVSDPGPTSSSSGADAHGPIAGNLAANHPPTPGSDTTASVLPTPGPEPDKPDFANYLRVFRMDDRRILSTQHISDGLVHVALDEQGFYDTARTGPVNWQILYHRFGGSESIIDQVQSYCSPPLDVLAPGIVLVSGCDESGSRQLIVITRDSRRLWQAQSSATHIWPLLATSANGLRLARAVLDVSHPVTASSPLDDSAEIHGQTVQVFDVATGNVVLSSPARPIFDGGGNFALSPSGNRFAILNSGEIQIYDLAPAPSLPVLSDSAR